nr:ATP-binding protein [Streptomyces anatolicus]
MPVRCPAPWRPRSWSETPPLRTRFRAAGTLLIITSNRAPSDWYPVFPDPIAADSLLDRLINISHQVIMNGSSYRPNKRPRNPTDKTK